ncbi:MAG: NAD-dependent deacylase [Bacteroidales bacterium]|nr:NAD-dependent deacylase [Bacteroidales bacterium]
MKKLVVLTGAGMSQESGLMTFRDMGGLWEQYDVTEVASPIAWENDRDLVLRFYNERRKQLLEVEPNKGHIALSELENEFQVDIITQNVDDLHERAGSSKILHLHGELRKARSTSDPSIITEIDGWELKSGDLCARGSQLRPHIVWFGESVPAIEDAVSIVQDADIFVIIGTSLNVYPAAGLIDYVPHDVPIYLIDPNEVASTRRNVHFIKEGAVKGVAILKEILLDS